VDIRELGRLDLNLLVALEALLEERNVSRAAERLFITQSAMSKTLGRLRELFDDPLFIRKSSGMVPTPRAEQIAEQLPQLLQAVQGMFQPIEFDPLTYVGQFNLLVQGHMGTWLMPRLVDRLSRGAPGIRLRSVSTAVNPFELLDNGRLDFILHAERYKYPPDFRLTTLGYAPPILLARKGHPLEGKTATWEMLMQYPNVQLIMDELADINFEVRQGSAFMQNMEKVVPTLQTDQLSTAIQVVRQSDYLFPAPPLFMEQGDISQELIALQIPEGEEVSLKYVMVKHPRVDRSPAHQFLYEKIIEVIECFRNEYGLPSLAQLRARRNLDY
jgi:DNA-binding transcriptional LysR family regulator